MNRRVDVDLEPVELEPLDVDDQPLPPREPVRIRPGWVAIVAGVVALWIVLAVVTHDDGKRAVGRAAPAATVLPTTAATVARAPRSAEILLAALRGTGSGRFAAVINDDLFVLDTNAGTARSVGPPSGPIEIGAKSGDELLVHVSGANAIVDTRTMTVSELASERFAIPAVEAGHWWFVQSDGYLRWDGVGAQRVPSDLRVLAAVDGGFLALSPQGYVLWNGETTRRLAVEGEFLASTRRMVAFRNHCSISGCSIAVYDLRGGAPVHTTLDIVVQSAVFSPRGTRLALQPTQSAMVVIDTATAAVLTRTQSRESTESAPPFTWTTNAELLVVQPDALEIRDTTNVGPPRTIVGADGLKQIVALP